MAFCSVVLFNLVKATIKRLLTLFASLSSFPLLLTNLSLRRGTGLLIFLFQKMEKLEACLILFVQCLLVDFSRKN